MSEKNFLLLLRLSFQKKKKNETHQILNYFKKLNFFISLFDQYPQLLEIVIPPFNDDDASLDKNIKISLIL